MRIFILEHKEATEAGGGDDPHHINAVFQHRHQCGYEHHRRGRVVGDDPEQRVCHAPRIGVTGDGRLYVGTLSNNAIGYVDTTLAVPTFTQVPFPAWRGCTDRSPRRSRHRRCTRRDPSAP